MQNFRHFFCKIWLVLIKSLNTDGTLLNFCPWIIVWLPSSKIIFFNFTLWETPFCQNHLFRTINFLKKCFQCQLLVNLIFKWNGLSFRAHSMCHPLRNHWTLISIETNFWYYLNSLASWGFFKSRVILALLLAEFQKSSLHHELDFYDAHLGAISVWVTTRNSKMARNGLILACFSFLWLAFGLFW